MAKSFVRLVSRLRIGLFVLCLNRRARLQRLNDPPREPQKKALLIGICGKGRPPADEQIASCSSTFSCSASRRQLRQVSDGRLKGPHRDVKGMRDVLVDLYEYVPSNITILLDDPVYTQPTKKNILKAIDELVRDARPGDRFMFCFAGHSGQVDTGNPKEEDGMDEHIVSCDGEWIKDDILHDRLVKPLPPGCTLRAVIDACHSGSLLDLDHYTCNRIYVPWISKGGKRNVKTLWYKTVKQNAMLLAPAAKKSLAHTPNLPSISSVMSNFASSLTQTIIPRRPKLCIITENISNLVDPEGHLVQSPQAGFCDGIGCFELNLKDLPPRADVLCLSSSQDAQKTWEGPEGRSMISFLIELLRKNRKPTLKDMMAHVSHEIHDMYVEMHFKARKYKKEKAAWLAEKQSKQHGSSNPGLQSAPPQGEARGSILPRRRPAPKKTMTLELVNFQDPELSSHFPISPDEMNLRYWDM